MIGARRLRQTPEMIEHDRRRKPAPEIRGVGNLVAAHMDLHVPSKRVDPLRERLDHVNGGGGGRRIELGEADAADPALRQRLELGIRDGGMDDGNAARISAELGNSVQGHAVVGDIDRRRHDHDAGGPDPLLQQLIFFDSRVRLQARSRPQRRKALGIVDVHVAVAGVCRRLEHGPFAAGGIGDLLRPAFPRTDGCAQNRQRRAIEHRPPSNRTLMHDDLSASCRGGF